MVERSRSLENLAVNEAFWRGRRVFVTGHTGFKGGWLVLWLKARGALVTGYALAPDTLPNLYGLADVARGIDSNCVDVRDVSALRASLARAEPELVFHLAAQPLVRRSYREPVETFTTNVLGTVNLLEAVRSCPTVKVVQVITTDKVYENREWPWPYRENDPLGGRDPYASSKAGAELAVASYRKSFFADARVSVASARAGNVIGGGDWSEDRLLPDCIRAFQAGRPVVLRRPGAVRPWQHVLEPLAGYMCLAEAQWRERESDAHPDSWRFATAFNFGPDSSGEATVAQIAEWAAAAWGEGARVTERPEPGAPHEAGVLALDPSLARARLGWEARWPVSEAVERAVAWYRRVERGENARALCLEQIGLYEAARRRGERS